MTEAAASIFSSTAGGDQKKTDGEGESRGRRGGWRVGKRAGEKGGGYGEKGEGEGKVERTGKGRGEVGDSHEMDHQGNV